MRKRLPEMIMRRQALIVDVGLVVWMIGISLYMSKNWALENNPNNDWADLDPVGVILIFVIHVPLIWRRRAPVPVLLVVSAACAVYIYFTYYHSIVTFAVALAIYSVSAYRSRATGLRGLLLGFVVVGYENSISQQSFQAAGTAIAMVICTVAWTFGDNARQLSERGSRLAELSEQLRREQEERARRAVAQEQSRIARELHDVVAHHMSVISVQAGLGRYVFDTDPGTTRRTLTVIGDTAHEALSEMRRLLSVLRTSAEEERTPYDAAPGLDRIADLVERMRDAGANVQLKVIGAAITLTPGAELCVYRVVQESLTNVLKHADPPIATITLDWRGDELRVEIRDQGRTTGKRGSETGLGLIGMAERARIYRGRLEAGPRPEGGFAVVLNLPTKEPDE